MHVTLFFADSSVSSDQRNHYIEDGMATKTTKSYRVWVQITSKQLLKSTILENIYHFPRFEVQGYIISLLFLKGMNLSCLGSQINPNAQWTNGFLSITHLFQQLIILQCLMYPNFHSELSSPTKCIFGL